MLAHNAHLCVQECWDQPVSEIQQDIYSLMIDPMKHFRALEKVYGVNIYFIMEDVVEPYLRKPPHSQFYLHRNGDPKKPVILFYSPQDRPEIYTILTTRLNPTKQGVTAEYLFENAAHLDDVMNRTNIIQIVSPSDRITTRLIVAQVKMQIGSWKAVE